MWRPPEAHDFAIYADSPVGTYGIVEAQAQLVLALELKDTSNSVFCFGLVIF